MAAVWKTIGSYAYPGKVPGAKKREIFSRAEPGWYLCQKNLTVYSCHQYLLNICHENSTEQLTVPLWSFDRFPSALSIGD